MALVSHRTSFWCGLVGECVAKAGPRCGSGSGAWSLVVVAAVAVVTVVAAAVVTVVAAAVVTVVAAAVATVVAAAVVVVSLRWL